MARKLNELQDEVDDLQGTVDEVSDLVDEALDPELSREEVVSKLKEIQEAVSSEQEEGETSGEE
jgi:hypothetical protein